MPSKTKQMKVRRSWLDSRERAWWAIVLAVLAVLGVACWLALFFGRTDLGQGKKDGGPSRNSSTDSGRAERESSSEQASRRQVARVFYAYSVIPGGVRSVAELKSAIARDPVVSAEYANFRLEDARVIQLEQDRSVHLAYRVGSRVFWTSRKATLERGETVITDGVAMARTKCGNLISEGLPGGPVSPDEPTEIALNTPIDVHYDSGGPEADDRFPELSPPPPSNTPPPSYETPIYQPPYFAPPVGGSPWSGGGEPVAPAPPPPIPHPQGSPPPSPPVISTPEPGTGVQFLLGAVGILFLLWRAKARRCLEQDGGTR